MSPTYAQNKEHIYNWVKKNPELHAINSKLYNEINEVKYIKRVEGQRRYNKERKRFLLILLE